MSRLEMTQDERESFLAQSRTLRLGTVDGRGWPIVTPVWYVWHADAFWVWSLRGALRTERLVGGGRASVTVDDGEEYETLRGVIARVRAQAVEFADAPARVNELFGLRYLPYGAPLQDLDDHVWLRLEPLGWRTWDFRKMRRPAASS